MTAVLVQHADGSREVRADWLGLIEVTDDEARAWYAEKFGVSVERVELVRDNAIVKVREKSAADCSRGGRHSKREI